MDQSWVETEKALDDLRNYCQSPKCAAWKVASRLQSPTRFAEFVQGSPHVTEDEVMSYSHVDFNDIIEETDDEEEIGENGDTAAHLMTDDEESNHD